MGDWNLFNRSQVDKVSFVASKHTPAFGILLESVGEEVLYVMIEKLGRDGFQTTMLVTHGSDTFADFLDCIELDIGAEIVYFTSKCWSK